MEEGEEAVADVGVGLAMEWAVEEDVFGGFWGGAVGAIAVVVEVGGCAKLLV